MPSKPSDAVSMSVDKSENSRSWPEDAVVFLLAGAHGPELHELTQGECRAAIHFVSGHRLVDFAMASAVQSGVTRMVVATQYQPGTLLRHLSDVWAPLFPREGLMLRNSPVGKASLGTAEVMRDQAALLDEIGAKDIIVLSGNDVFKMDFKPLIADHRASGAMVTVCENGRDVAVPDSLTRTDEVQPGSGRVLIFSWPWLRSLLQAGHLQMTDLEQNVVPHAMASGVARRSDPGIKASFGYWRRIITLDDFRSSALDFARPPLPCPLPLARMRRQPPDVSIQRSRFSAELDVGGIRILSPLVASHKPGSWAMLDETILMPGARVSPGVRLTRCVVAPGTPIPERFVAGEDPWEDRHWFRVTSQGTTLITTAMLARRAAERSIGRSGFKGVGQKAD